MNYIQKLKWQRDKLVEFYYGYCALDDAHKKFETTAYKGDAQNAVKAAYVTMNAVKKEVEDQIIASIKTEGEMKNAG